MRADPEEKQGLAKNIEHWGVGQSVLTIRLRKEDLGYLAPAHGGVVQAGRACATLKFEDGRAALFRTIRPRVGEEA